MAKPKHAWMVRAGGDNELADLIKGKGAVAIGWRELGDPSHLSAPEQFERRYRQAYPEDSEDRSKRRFA